MGHLNLWESYHSQGYDKTHLKFTIMNTIIDKKWYRTDRFEPVTEIPYGYFVWNIGRRNFPHERCIPLAKDGINQEPWQMNVDTKTLKYIVIPTEELALQILNEASRKGVSRERFYEILNA